MKLFVLTNLIGFLVLAQQTLDLNGSVHVGSCSGTIAKFKNESENNLAKVLTVGHCAGGSNTSIINKPANYAVKGHNTASGEKTESLAVTKILYSTMKQTDMALLQLNLTYEQLRQKGFTIYTISDKDLNIGDDIAMLSGSKHSVQYCKLADKIKLLREGELEWYNGYKYIDCVSRPGFSGSALVNMKDLEIYGVNNTGNDSGEYCTNNNPCEIDEQGNKKIDRTASYGQNTYVLYSCLNNKFDLDFSLPSCSLEK